jgi:hypothetical protein
MKDNAMHSDEAPKPDQKPDPLADPKATAPPTMPALSPREAARLWGTSSLGGPKRAQRFPYSKT